MTTSTADLTLTFEDVTITAFDTDTDNPTFLASPIAKKLGHADAAHMLRNLDDDERGLHNVETPYGPQEMAVVTLPGLMHALNNRRPGAIKDPETRAMVERFQRWVNHEVLPTILRTGHYVADNQPTDAADKDGVIRALATANHELIESNAALRDALRETTRLLASRKRNTPRRHPDDEERTPAERWYLQQIAELGYVVPGDCPFPESMTAHKAMIDRFGLKTSTRRILREGCAKKQVTRILLPTSLTPEP